MGNLPGMKNLLNINMINLLHLLYMNYSLLKIQNILHIFHCIAHIGSNLWLSHIRVGRLYRMLFHSVYSPYYMLYSLYWHLKCTVRNKHGIEGLLSYIILIPILMLNLDALYSHLKISDLMYQYD